MEYGEYLNLFQEVPSRNESELEEDDDDESEYVTHQNKCFIEAPISQEVDNTLPEIDRERNRGKGNTKRDLVCRISVCKRTAFVQILKVYNAFGSQNPQQKNLLLEVDPSPDVQQDELKHDVNAFHAFSSAACLYDVTSI
ncbi:hypothetical protein FQR65_LT02342 [Abscondita terminalis]|nr:hypothetical protein FQR65_LT02342 [Abscondita terminalis]